MTKATVEIREEALRDHAGVRRVNEAAFSRAAEADLVDALRRLADPYLSLVAEVGGVVVGHLFFTPVEIESDEAGIGGSWVEAFGLAPMAVLPEHQGQGVGSALARAGLEACERAGCGAVFVLGHPDYYPRFGFVPARTRGFDSGTTCPTRPSWWRSWCRGRSPVRAGASTITRHSQRWSSPQSSRPFPSTLTDHDS